MYTCTYMTCVWRQLGQLSHSLLDTWDNCPIAYWYAWDNCPIAYWCTWDSCPIAHWCAWDSCPIAYWCTWDSCPIAYWCVWNSCPIAYRFTWDSCPIAYTASLYTTGLYIAHQEVCYYITITSLLHHLLKDYFT